MFQRKQKLKVLAENNDHLQDKLRRRDEKIKRLNDQNFQLTEKMKKISKTQDANICIICFDSVSMVLNIGQGSTDQMRSVWGQDRKFFKESGTRYDGP